MNKNCTKKCFLVFSFSFRGSISEKTIEHEIAVHLFSLQVVARTASYPDALELL